MELKQAKGQSHDLHRTGEYLTKLMTQEPRVAPPESPEKIQQEQKEEREPIRGPNNHSHDVMMSPDPVSPFTQPPMPPPSQPLPDKPDVNRSFRSDSVGQGIRRVDTEKPSSNPDSPTKSEPQNGQIVSLLETLKSVKQESVLQGDRIKHLELALKRERRARESAERRARAFSDGRQSSVQNEDGVVEEGAFDPPLDSIELLDQDFPNGHMEDEDGNDNLLRSSASMETLREPNQPHRGTEEIDASTSQLQTRLDLMVQEMGELKKAMESYKRRAEDAEEGRQSLAEMVENIRAGRDSQKVRELESEDTTLIGSNTNSGESPSSARGLSNIISGNHGLWTSSSKRQTPNGNVSPEDMQRELERTLSNVLQQQRPGEHGRIAQSAPYVSMVGVVLIGVGIMTWLNGWQSAGDSR